MKFSTRLIHVSTRAKSFEDFSFLIVVAATSSAGADLCLITAAITRNTTGIMAQLMVSIKCLVLTLPMNNSNMQLAPSNKAVDKLAGAMSIQVTATGRITGR